MFDQEKIDRVCLRCKYFRVKNSENGQCKVDKAAVEDLLLKGINDSCERWLDAGQQYYIRLGWMKKQQEKVEQQLIC